MDASGKGAMVEAFEDRQRENRSVSSAQSISSGDDVLGFLNSNYLKDPASRDLLFSYMLSEKSANSAYQRELQADSTKYQRLVNDLTKAGINPLYALSGASAGSVTSSGSSFSSGYRAQHESEYDRKQSESNKEKDVASNIVRGILVAAAAVLGALL